MRRGTRAFVVLAIVASTVTGGGERGSAPASTPEPATPLAAIPAGLRPRVSPSPVVPSAGAPAPDIGVLFPAPTTASPAPTVVDAPPPVAPGSIPLPAASAAPAASRPPVRTDPPAPAPTFPDAPEPPGSSASATTPLPMPDAAAAATPTPSLPPLERVPLPRETWDVVVYGGTPGGILAAVTAARAGARVVVLEPSGHIGGMMTNGLTYTDVGDHTTIGGYTADFFSRMAYVGGTVASRYHFEGKVAERELWALLRGAGVRVHLGQALREQGGVEVRGGAIEQLTMTSGLVFAGRVFIDATYEGDLMARSGVTYRVGRESIAEYGEALAGAGVPAEIMVVPEGIALGFPTSPEPGPPGSADLGVQNSNFRPCFSLDPANQVPFPVPQGYDPASYEILLEWMRVQEEDAGRGPAQLGWFMWLGALPNQKFDVNEYGSMSLGLPGANWAYPEGTAGERDAITDLHRAYDQGFLWFLRHDPRVPAAVRDELARYGLCADEFTDNANWPRRIYLREGRRMVGTYVLTQHDIASTRTKPDIIGIGSYPLDSHYVSRWITDDRRLMFEGGFFTGETRQYAMPYRILLPRPGEVGNLLVPVAASASHVAFASLRMEPQFMLLGEAAGQAAAMAVATGPDRVDLHGLSVPALQAALVAHGSKLTNPIGPAEEVLVTGAPQDGE